MQQRNNKISVTTVRNANRRLVSKSARKTIIVSDDSKNGDISFRAMYNGKAFDVYIPKEKIRTAYAKAISETIL